MIWPWPSCLPQRVSRTGCRVALLASLVSVVALAAVACSQEPLTLEASGPIPYPAYVDSPFQRVAIVVTITNKSGDDLAVNPADFVARDAEHRIYPANPTEAASDAQAVRLASAHQRGVQSLRPLPTVTLRQDDVLSGFLVFDVPSGTQIVEVIWRQSDTDYAAQLPATR